MPAPLAYFLTWTTYATHLRGHRSGSTDHKRSGQGNTPIPPSTRLQHRERNRLNDQSFRLCPAARSVVSDAITEHAHFKRWRILALAVQSNHVHLLISADTPPESVMTSCKRWATRSLRQADLLGKNARAWTRHGSTRWINDHETLQRAYHYITEFQEGPKAAKRYQNKDIPPY